MTIHAQQLHFSALNEAIRADAQARTVVEGCLGHRYIGSGLGNKTIEIYGVPGNALGAYLNGASILVHANAQDATGDTMNAGEIVVHGSSGDATGYAMRGGRILVRDNAGYRAGIHMKAYQDKIPVLVIGGEAGSFLGEYQAGGRIVVLGLQSAGKAPVGYFCGTGMHGGKIFLRCNQPPQDLPGQVSAAPAGPEDLQEIRGDVEAYCAAFGADAREILSAPFYVLTPNTKNPYKQLYTPN
ncbi:MAG: glutamate synthase [Eubacteriales bacterium]|nr:glutamate synthase [Eubacteriales bacterium]